MVFWDLECVAPGSSSFQSSPWERISVILSVFLHVRLVFFSLVAPTTLSLVNILTVLFVIYHGIFFSGLVYMVFCVFPACVCGCFFTLGMFSLWSWWRSGLCHWPGILLPNNAYNSRFWYFHGVLCFLSCEYIFNSSYLFLILSNPLLHVRVPLFCTLLNTLYLLSFPLSCPVKLLEPRGHI